MPPLLGVFALLNMKPNKITIDIYSLNWSNLLDDWAWLLQKNYSPILVTAFGDMFLRDENGRVDFLDLISGKLTQVADSVEEMQQLINVRENQVEWLMIEVFAALQTQGVYFGEGQCYSFIQPPVLGGQLEPDNIEVTDIYTHVSLAGQIHRQVKDLSAGTKITDIKIG